MSFADSLILQIASNSISTSGNSSGSTVVLPVTSNSDGGSTVTLDQSKVDAIVAAVPLPAAAMIGAVHLLAPATAAVQTSSNSAASADPTDAVAVQMTAAIAIDDPATNTSTIYDVRVQSTPGSSLAPGTSVPIQIEAWRRNDDGTPMVNPTSLNRSFWGTLSGQLEQ
jgi:hypothetical protein